MHQPPAHSWLEISKRALLHNISAHRRLLNKKTKLMAVVKSNAYGHGLELVGKICEESRQVDWLGVAYLEEALKLRSLAKKLPILVLSHYLPYNASILAKAIKSHISFMTYEIGQIKALERASKIAGRRACIHLKLETGMARLGLFPKQAKYLLQQIVKSPYLRLEGIASHFATAEDQDQTFLKKQLNSFKAFIKANHDILPSDIIQHISCTAAITTAPNAHLNLARLGIGLYGLWPSRENQQLVKKIHPHFTLKPVLFWKTKIIEIQNLPKDVPVGYARSFITRKPTVMAAIPVGYWEGYDRKLSNNGVVLIHSQRCPIIGRICMNISMVDITRVKNVKVGDEVVLIGTQGNEEITADEIAKKVGTINYEVVTRINPQLPRILIN
ncbi:MAG: alanine racemase [Patescibacteria group bacterium]